MTLKELAELILQQPEEVQNKEVYAHYTDDDGAQQYRPIIDLIKATLFNRDDKPKEVVTFKLEATTNRSFFSSENTLYNSELQIADITNC